LALAGFISERAEAAGYPRVNSDWKLARFLLCDRLIRAGLASTTRWRLNLEFRLTWQWLRLVDPHCRKTAGSV